MILEIDVGNTFVKWRLLSVGEVAHAGKALTADIESMDVEFWSDSVTEVRVASVAGVEKNRALSELVRDRCACEPLFAKTVSSCAGVKNSYIEPSRMGVDRWLVMLAANARAEGASCIVDCGSAITVDYLDEHGQHLGGYIMPGLRLMNKALLADTAEIRVDQDIDHFDLSPGKHTSAAVVHGINFVFKALQEKISEEINNHSSMRLFITGGDGELFHSLCQQGEYVEDLVMDGLRLSEWR